MRKQKIKPGSFIDRAESRVQTKSSFERIDLHKLWNEEVELEPSKVASLSEANKCQV